MKIVLKISNFMLRAQDWQYSFIFLEKQWNICNIKT